jgi:hypothetical protein
MTKLPTDTKPSVLHKEKEIEELKARWKEKWLVKKETKCWWEKMVEESFLAGQNSKEKKDLEIIKKGFEGCDDLVDLEKELTQKIKEKDK